MKKSIIVLFLINCLIINSQNRIVKNVNTKANILEHILTKNGKNLYLGSDKKINSMKVINTSEEKLVDCHNQNLFIYPLNNLKIGINTIMVFIDDKIIVFTIIMETIPEINIIEKKDKKIIAQKTIKKVSPKKPYNLSNQNRLETQSREEYRKNNLRPNGKPYQGASKSLERKYYRSYKQKMMDHMIGKPVIKLT